MRHTNCVHRRIGVVNDCLVPVISELMRIKIALVERERDTFFLSPIIGIWGATLNLLILRFSVGHIYHVSKRKELRAQVSPLQDSLSSSGCGSACR